MANDDTNGDKDDIKDPNTRFNEDDVSENKSVDRIIDPSERQQWDEDDASLAGDGVGETETGMEDVDEANRKLGQQEGASDEGSIVEDDDFDDEDDIVDMPM